MSETWKRWEGQVVNGEFPLLRFLGSSNHSAVFLTERRGTVQKAAIKLIPADPHGPESQLRRWQRSAKLAHPHLVRVFESGRCDLEGTPLLFVVMEAAEEDLSQILPERPLSPEEVREMLPPVLEALAYVYGQGLVHGQLRPSNILAAGDQVKVSADTLRESGVPVTPRGEPDAYDPPEARSGTLTPASDMWSLGITLVEVLTRQRPAWDPEKPASLSLPKDIPEPFVEIARHCLQIDPQQRWTVADISARLRPPQPIPARLPVPKAAALEEKKPTRWGYALAVTAAVVVALILMAMNRTRSTSPAAQPAEVQHQEAGPGGAALPEPAPPPKEPKPSPATRAKASPESAAIENVSQSAVLKGAVLQQVLPRVSPSARDTIEGKIRVRVRVEVDSSGNVTDAALVSPGPSKYFARLALEAARGWKFSPPQARGHVVASQWTLRFGFRRTDTEVVPTQTAP